MTAIKVSMGIILDSEGKILIAQRNLQKNFGGMWEFPGGKQEADESPEQALIRELKEELSIEVEVLRSFQPYDYKDEKIKISFYPIHCKIIGGMIVNNEHEEVIFISLEEIDNFEFAPPDYKTVDLVKENFADMIKRSDSKEA